MKNVAFIPARGGSKSIKKKNIKLFNGRPLIYWSIDAAVKCKYIDEVFVSTDSEEIKQTVLNYGDNKVKVIERTDESATDIAATEVSMLDFAKNIEFENIALIQATSPLLKTEDLDKGFEKLNNSLNDSILSLVRQKRFIWEESQDGVIPKNYNPLERPMRQNFNGFLVENGSFYITSKKLLLENKCRISGKIGHVIMEEETYFEIDEPSDWIIVESIASSKKNNEYNLKKIKAFFTDCDGVLTDGGMYYSEKGDELKKFNTKDGMAFELLKQRGIITGIITGEKTELVKKRAEKLKLDEIHLGIKNKAEVLDELIKKYNITYDEVAYIGDDINDLEVLSKVGFGCVVSDGLDKCKSIAKYITKIKGGEGALREVVDIILS